METTAKVTARTEDDLFRERLAGLPDHSINAIRYFLTQFKQLRDGRTTDNESTPEKMAIALSQWLLLERVV